MKEKRKKPCRSLVAHEDDRKKESRLSMFAPWLVLSVLALPLLAILSNGEFLWTDIAEIKDRALVASSIEHLFTQILHGVEGHYYRPTVLVMHSLNYWMFGESPVAFRATNLIIHVVNVFLVYRVLRELGISLPRVYATAGLFVVHPLVVTPISWVSDRTDLIALMGSLGFIALVQQYVKKRNFRSLVIGALIFFVTLGAKETAAATMFLVGVLIIGTTGRTRRAFSTVAAVQTLVICAWFFWRSQVENINVTGNASLSMIARLSLSVSNWSFQTGPEATVTG